MLLRVPLIKFPKWTHLSPNSYWFPFYGRKRKGTYSKMYRKSPIMKNFANFHLKHQKYEDWEQLGSLNWYHIYISGGYKNMWVFSKI